LATKKKYKKMTNKEKQHAKEFREELREKGILPPVKPKLNRKKFAKEVREEWQEHGDIFYLHKAFGCMIPSGEFETNISPEQIGALKVLKIAIEYKKFEEDLKAKGETTYSVGELYEKVIAPIINL
jgi:hypothetical protein